MGQAGSSNYKKNDNYKELVEEKIDIKSTQIYKFLLDNSEKEDYIELTFKDKDGIPKFNFFIKEDNKGKIFYHINGINEAFRPEALLFVESTRSNKTQLYLKGRWSSTGFLVHFIIHIPNNIQQEWNEMSLYHYIRIPVKDKPYIIRVMLYDYNLPLNEDIDNKLYWSRLKIEEFYIFKKEN